MTDEAFFIELLKIHERWSRLFKGRTINAPRARAMLGALERMRLTAYPCVPTPVVEQLKAEGAEW